MVSLGPIFATFLITGGVYTAVTNNTVSETQTKSSSVKKSEITTVAMSSLDIAKGSILAGGFESTDKFYINGADTGYLYLKSTALNKIVKDLPLSEGVISVAYKIEAPYVKIIVKAIKNDKEMYLGAAFELIGNESIMPLAYAGSGTFSGGTMCTVGYDETNNVIGDVLNPDFNFYLDSNFSANPTFVIPTGATNEKDLQIHARTNVTVTGYKTIDKVYAGGDITLKGGSTVNVAVAGGKVYKDYSSSATSSTNNGNYTYPDINKTFADNAYSFASSDGMGGTKESITCGTGSCNELASQKGTNCTVPTNPYTTNPNKTTWKWGYDNGINNQTCLNQYGTNGFTTVSNPYTSNPKKDAWNWGYSNSTGDCKVKYGVLDYSDLTSANSHWLDYNNKQIVFDWTNPYHRERRNIGVTPYWGPVDEARIWMYKFDNPGINCTSYLTSASNTNQVDEFDIKGNLQIEKLRRAGYIWGVENKIGNCSTKYNSYMTSYQWTIKYGYINGDKWYEYDSSKFIQPCEEGQTNQKWCASADSFYNDVYLASDTEAVKTDTELSCEQGKTAYINRTPIKVANATSDICNIGYNAKKNYDTCIASETSSCTESNSVTIDSGNYDMLIIGNNCDLTLLGDDYTFTKVVAKNNADINFEGKSVEFKANTIEMKNNSEISYNGTAIDSYLIISSNTTNLGNNSALMCTDPRKCLFDTNTMNATNNSVIQGSILARDTANITQAKIYGNIISEKANTVNADICNIIDSSGNQLMAKSYFDVAAESGSSFANDKITKLLSQVMCSSFQDCMTKLQ